MRNYVGLASTFHDSAIAIVNDVGEIVFAEATERYQQNKRAIQCPADDVNRIHRLLQKYCDPGAEIVMAETWSGEIAEDLDRSRKALEAMEAGDLASIDAGQAEGLWEFGVRPQHLDTPGGRLLFEVMRWHIVAHCAQAQITGNQLRLRLANNDRKFIKRAYKHHLTHALLACQSSPFEEAVCAVMDGSGENNSNDFFHYKNGQLTEINPPGPPTAAHGSLGFFYWHLCNACGFDPLAGEEWKVMGLAPYGKLDPAIYDILKPMLVHSTLSLRYAEDYPQRIDAMLKLRRPPGSPSRTAADLAYTGQLVFSELSKALLDDLYDLGLSQNLVVSGGCALNSSWNGRILEQTKFSKLHVYSAPADDGNALGAALLAYQEDHPQHKAPAKTMTPYLGETMSRETLDLVTGLGGMKNVLPPGRAVEDYTAELLSKGAIVGWAQGRAEFGPRALGNRSILADPRDPEMKDKINSRVKFREEYRPFAPSILHEYGPQYFENYQESPYMERTLRFVPAAKAKIPAVYHEDGTGRLQSVKREWNARYHALISAFHERTGVPLLLNTSFNVMGKPIIHSVEDALAVFFTTGLDVLVIEELVFVKPGFVARSGG